MSYATKKQREIAETRLAEAQGRPIRSCGNCGAIGVGHWVPDHIDPESEQLVRGGYECKESAR